MADYKNIPLGLRTQTQIPLDVKEYIQNESLLSNLGVNGQLAYTYTKGLVVYCIEESTRWEWTEVKPGLEDTGLINQDFIYSDNHIAFGIDYSNKRYNFVKITSGSETKVTAGTNVTVTGNGSTGSPYVINSTDTIANGSETKINAGTNVTVTGNGTSVTPYVINSSGGGGTPQGIQNTILTNPLIDIEAAVQIEYGSSLTFRGTDTQNLVSPYLRLDTEQSSSSGDDVIAQFGVSDGTGELFDTGIEVNQYGIYVRNPGGSGVFDYDTPIGNFTDNSLITKEYSDYNFQKEITTSYTVVVEDNNHTIFINNGASNINITIPVLSTLNPNIEIGFVQQGTGLVTFVASGTTLNTPTGLKIKGQNYQAFIQRIGITNVWHVLGNVIV